MNPEKSSLLKIDMVISHDWSKTINLYNTVYHKWIDDSLPGKRWIEEYHTYQFDFSSYGSLVSLDSITDQEKTAAMLNGPLVESTLPWIKKLKEDLKGLDLVAVTFFETTGSIHKHKDGVVSSEKNKGHCRLNYILTNCDAVTYIDNDGVIESYPSIANTAWLFDTQKDHWVENPNNARRHLFQLTFNQHFEDVREWFLKKGALRYGNN